jgi:hypothetical protein
MKKQAVMASSHGSFRKMQYVPKLDIVIPSATTRLTTTRKEMHLKLIAVPIKTETIINHLTLHEVL